MRGGRYRYQMIERQKLQVWSSPLEKVFGHWKNLCESKVIEEWEFVALYLVLFVFLDRPKERWSRGGKEQRSRSGNEQRDRGSKVQGWQGGEALWVRGSKDCAVGGTSHRFLSAAQVVLDVFSGILPEDHLERWRDGVSWVEGDLMNLRGVPALVLSSLRGWRDQKNTLQLLHRVPTGEELLALQTRGVRCVTALITKTEIEVPVEEGRDVWSFCLHDLLHAGHFFSQPRFLKAQRFLSALFLKFWREKDFQRDLEQDSIWKKDFEYIAADMNAHPVYILMSFCAKYLEFFKRQNGLSERQALSLDLEQRWSLRWMELLALVLDSEQNRFGFRAEFQVEKFWIPLAALHKKDEEWLFGLEQELLWCGDGFCEGVVERSFIQ